MARQSFIAEGWALLHDAMLRAGAEVDYYPPDEPELGARTYVSPEIYKELAAPLVELASVDIEAFGNRADLIKRAIWRWIRKTAQVQAKEYWKLLLPSRNGTLVLAEFSEVLADGRFSGGPSYEPSNPISVVRYGHWLVNEQARTDLQSIVPVIWGLALIGAGWRKKVRRGYCEFCYRHAYPGGRYCHFHRQGGRSDEERSKAYIRYSKGRLAAVLDREVNAKSREFSKSAILNHEGGDGDPRPPPSRQERLRQQRAGHDRAPGTIARVRPAARTGIGRSRLGL